MRDDEERTPLRTILKNFINHIENLETKRIEDSYEKEFQDLKFFSEILKTLKQHSCSEGEKEVNRKKNRYKDILPFDGSRVILGEYAGVPGSDYINANFIKGASGSPAYIASQGPLPHTVNDFWRMVVECEVQVIVMACNQEEAGKHKCENYWVEQEGEEKQFGMVTIRLLKASIVCPDFLVRTMLLKYTNNQSIIEERTVCQFHYSAWPDHGVPPLVRPLLDMVRLVRDTQASETLPVLIHCSAGCGRTGTICAIDYVFGLLRAGKLTKNFSLYTLVRDMRKQRIAMVQTKEQYVLVHQAVRELFCEQLRMIDAHPYENIDANGMPLIKEPLYATVNGEDSSEKQDEKEKNGSLSSLLDAPPLPDKKKVNKASSKQAKEVENLTEKQRCTVEQSSDSESGSLSSGMSSLLSKPRISKLKALFERNLTPRESRTSSSRRRGNQPVARSHSLGPVRKETVESKDESSRLWRQPIPGRGILRVPQLATAPVTPAPKPALPVKRSKSLKVLGSGEHPKLSVLIPESSRSRDTANRVDVLVKNKSVASIIKKPLVPSKESPSKSRGVETSVISQTRTSRDGVLPSSSPVEMSAPRHGQVAYMAWRNYENVPTPLRRRHSLESVILEEVVPSVNLSDKDYIGSGRSEFQTSRLDQDARKLLQDCRDYLNNSKIESRTPLRSSLDVVGRPSDGNQQFQHLSADAQRKINAIVAGLGVRERRNSFRQAVGMNRDPSGRVQDYESIWPGPRGPTTMEALRERREQRIPFHPFNSSLSPGQSGSARNNGLLMDKESRNLADELAGFYQKPADDFRISHSKFTPKSLTQKSGGSLRIKGSQALAFARGTELDGVAGAHVTPQKDVQERTKHPLQLSRSNPWPRGSLGPNLNHSDYVEVRSPQKRVEGPTDSRHFQETRKAPVGVDITTKTTLSTTDSQSPFNHSPYSDFETQRKVDAGPESRSFQFPNSRTNPLSLDTARKVNLLPANTGSANVHSPYAEIRSPPRRVEGAAEAKTLPIQGSKGNSDGVDGYIQGNPNSSDRLRPLSDQQIYVKRIPEERVQVSKTNPAFHKTMYNGVPPSMDMSSKMKSPNHGTSKQTDSASGIGSYLTFQDLRGNAWPNPEGSRSPRNSNLWPNSNPDSQRLEAAKTSESKRSEPRASFVRHDQNEPSALNLRAGYTRHEQMEAASKSRRTDELRGYTATSPQGKTDAVSYGLVAGIQLVDTPVAPPRVARRGRGGEATPRKNTPWTGTREEAPGDVDLDAVAASIKPRRPVGDQTATLTRALEALYMRKAAQRAESEQLAQSHVPHQAQGLSPQSPPVKKQQYL